MKLFELDDSYSVVYEAQTLLLKPFAALMKRDRSRSKTRAVKEMAFVFFYCDIKSDYMYHTDLDIRKESIKSDLVLGKDWKIDKLMKDAIEYYERMSTSSTAEILKDSLYTARTLSKKMKDAVDEDNLELDDVLKLLTGINKIPGVIKSLQIAEQTVLKEIQEIKGNVGSKEKAIFEDGL